MAGFHPGLTGIVCLVARPGLSIGCNPSSEELVLSAAAVLDVAAA